jgi:uncharacterized membrane-anchored protein YitT (DUF2179 family)/HD superfamily phosphodiesterase
MKSIKIYNYFISYFLIHLYYKSKIITFHHMKYRELYISVIEKLQVGLSANYSYHNDKHTISVVENAKFLAQKEGLNELDTTILLTAAVLHDVGFLIGRNNHELNATKWAKEMLPNFGYTNAEIDTICVLIMETKTPQRPTTTIAKILCDADLLYLGTDQYEQEAAKLFVELKKNNLIKTAREWEIRQIDFLSQHQFFTRTAKELGESKKQQHLEKLHQTVKGTIAATHKIQWWEKIKDYILIILGVTMAGFALKGFLVPNHFFDGGITGISLLLHEIYHFNLALTILMLNIPLIIVGYYTVGKIFATRTILSVLLLGISLWLLPTPMMTNDKLLISIFGGVFLGVGIGLVMRSGAALDSIEVLALYTLKRTSFSITEIILAINVIIFLIAAIEFGIETSLYSILTYFAASRSIDYIIEGLQAYTGVTIISSKSEELKFQLVNKLGRGITVYKGERGFLPGQFDVSQDCDIIFTVISRLEMRKLNSLVHEIDPKAFVFANTIKEASGGLIRRKHKH